MEKFEKIFKSIDSNIDAVLISSDVNRRYFTGMKSSAGFVLAFKEKAYLLIDFRYIEKAKSVVTNCEVVLMTSVKKQVNELLKKHNAKVMAVESEVVTISELNNYKKCFEVSEIDTTDSLSKAIRDLRSVKSKEEIEKIQKAQKIAEKAFDNVLNFIKPGVTEKEIALQLDFYMLKNGAEALSFETIALAGKRTSLPHGVPSDAVVKDGDFVLMDYGAVFDGYHSDMTRTICVGKPSEEMKEVYEIVLKAQKEAISKICAGVKGCDMDKISRDIITKNGYGDYFGHSLGHGVGVEIHEFPNLSPMSEYKLKENNVVTVEPGIYIPEKFGVRIEDFVVVNKNGCYNLTNTIKQLISI